MPVGRVLVKPDLAATDGARNTFFGNPSGGSFLFFGTSASAPHVAAIAALMKSSQPSIEPAALAGVLSSTSRPMPGGTPRSVGGGMVDALAAVSAIPADSPRISIGDASVTEGDSGTVEAIFPIRLWPALVDGSVTVDFTTADGTAKSPEDFAATSASLTFGPGETLRTIAVPVKGDNLPEGSETFGVNLGHAMGAAVSDASAIGTILDTDEDVVRFDPSAGYSLVFDGSDVGLGSAAIDGLARVDDDELLLSFAGSVTIPGVGSVRGEDLVRFTGTLGTDTRGTFRLALDGSDIGRNPSSDENIDAVELEDGVLYLSTKGSFFSTTGNFSVTGASGADEDAFQCGGTPHACDDSGSSFSLYFDGSARGLFRRPRRHRVRTLSRRVPWVSCDSRSGPRARGRSAAASRRGATRWAPPRSACNADSPTSRSRRSAEASTARPRPVRGETSGRRLTGPEGVGSPTVQRVRLVRRAECSEDTAQTPGMHRVAAISGAMAGSEGLWMGRTEVAPGITSAAHHHGHSETGIYVVSGSPAFTFHDGVGPVTLHAEPGDFVYLPPGLPHIEANPSPDSPAVVVVVRTTQEPIVENLDGLYP
ncbi:MAG: Calx-beta domain-containing protein, partial [Acidimicrobiia bacterium]